MLNLGPEHERSLYHFSLLETGRKGKEDHLCPIPWLRVLILVIALFGAPGARLGPLACIPMPNRHPFSCPLTRKSSDQHERPTTSTGLEPEAPSRRLTETVIQERLTRLVDKLGVAAPFTLITK